MIQGLSIDVKGEELAACISARVAHHRAQATAFQAQLRKLQKIKQRVGNQTDNIDAIVERESPKERLARKIREHGDRATALTFLRDHVLQGEIYRLNELDLRMAELLPERFPRW